MKNKLNYKYDYYMGDKNRYTRDGKKIDIVDIKMGKDILIELGDRGLLIGKALVDYESREIGEKHNEYCN